MSENFLDKTDDRTITNIDGFVIKVNRLILSSKSKSLKEFVTKSEYTNLTYDQISKPILQHYSFNKKTLQYEWNDGIKLKEIKNVSLIEDLKIEKPYNLKDVEKEKTQKKILNRETC